MDIFRSIAEEKIQEAIRRGDFHDLPGAGKPLPPDDAAHVPAELKMSYKMLKNAGMIPEEMQLRKDIVTLDELLALCRDDTERTKLQRELSAKKLRYQSLMSQRGFSSSGAYLDYKERIERKLLEEDHP